MRVTFNAFNAMYALTRRIIPLSCVAVLAVGLVQAQAVQTITLNDAVRIALDQNHQLKESANQVRQEENTLRRAKYFLTPNISLSMSSSRYFGLTFDQTTAQLVNFSSDGFSLGTNASLTVFEGFREWATLKRARLNVAATGLEHEQKRQLVVFQVMKQYLVLLKARYQVTIQQENLAEQEQLLEQVEQFANAGSRPVSDLFQQQAESASAELVLLGAQRDAEAAENLLIQMLQLDPFGEYDFVVPDLSARAPVPEDYDVEDMVRTAFERRLDLRAREAAIGVSEQGIRVARASWMPHVSLSARAGSSYSSLQGSATGRRTPFGTQLQNRRSESLGLSLSIPIFDKFATRTAVQTARIQHNNAQLSLESLRQEIRLNVRQAYLDYLWDEKSLDVSDKQLLAAQQALEAAQKQYNVGSKTLIELAQVRSSYVKAANNRADAISSFFFRKLLIDYYIGVLDPGKPLFE